MEEALDLSSDRILNEYIYIYIYIYIHKRAKVVHFAFLDFSLAES